MAYLEQEFDASQVEPQKPREVIPPGTYRVFVKESDVKPTKAATEAIQHGGGPKENDRVAVFTLEVHDGPHKGAVIFHNLNIANTSQTAQEIGQRQLSALCHAVGVLRVKDTNELHFREFLAVVDVEAKEGYSPKNVVKDVKPLEGGQAQVGSHAPQGQPQQAASGASVSQPAWNRKP